MICGQKRSLLGKILWWMKSMRKNLVKSHQIVKSPLRATRKSQDGQPKKEQFSRWTRELNHQLAAEIGVSLDY